MIYLDLPSFPAMRCIHRPTQVICEYDLCEAISQTASREEVSIAYWKMHTLPSMYTYIIIYVCVCVCVVFGNLLELWDEGSQDMCPKSEWKDIKIDSECRVLVCMALLGIQWLHFFKNRNLSYGLKEMCCASQMNSTRLVCRLDYFLFSFLAEICDSASSTETGCWIQESPSRGLKQSKQKISSRVLFTYEWRFWRTPCHF